MSTGIKIDVSLYVYNMSQEGIVLIVCFPSKTDMMVLLVIPVPSSANVSGWKTPLFSCHRRIGRLRAIFLRDKVGERSVTLLLRLIPAIFSGVSHRRIVRLFHEFFRRPKIPATESNNMRLQICAELLTP